MPEQEHDVTGRQFGRFQLLLELQRGGMATIYLARLVGPENFQKLVVIKRIHEHLADEQEFVDMFHDEAKIAGLIHHPNVVSILDFGTIGGAHFIAMEYVHGQSLVDLMRTAKRVTGLLPWQHVVRIIADAAAGLHAAHELKSPEGRPLNVVHRDVSPQNILLGYEGVVKVTDFGIAYAAERIAKTSTGILKGKLAYMSPEQAMSKPLDRRSDIFSLGTVMYEALCLKRLFKADNDAATLYNLLEAKVPKPSVYRPDIPKALDEIVLKALERDRDKRFATAGDLEDALNQVLIQEGQYVSNHQIAELMDQYFRDQRLLRESQIQQAMSEPLAQPVRVYVSGHGSSAGSLGTRGAESFQPRSKLWILLGLGGAALVGLVALVVGLVRSGSSSAESRKGSDAIDASLKPAVTMLRDARAVDRTKPRKPAFSTITVYVTTPSKGAVVRCQGKTYRGPEVKIRVPRKEGTVDVLISASGYKPKKRTVSAVTDSVLYVDLERKPRPVRPGWRPTRRPPRPRSGVHLKTVEF